MSANGVVAAGATAPAATNDIAANITGVRRLGGMCIISGTTIIPPSRPRPRRPFPHPLISRATAAAEQKCATGRGNDAERRGFRHRGHAAQPRRRTRAERRALRGDVEVDGAVVVGADDAVVVEVTVVPA